MPVVEISGYEFGYRLLTRKEFADLLNKANNNPVVFEDLVCSTCVTAVTENFEGFDDCLAGIPTELCAAVIQDSGYSDSAAGAVQEAIDWGRTKQARMDALICFCYPKLSLMDLEDLDPTWYNKYAVGAQLIIRGFYGMDPSGFLDPEKDQEPPTPQVQHRYAI